MRFSSIFRRSICLLLVIPFAAVPAAGARAQTNAAAQAVRQRVQGISQPPADAPPEQPPQPQAEFESATPSAPSAPVDGAIDTTFIAPSAAVVVVLRPAQLMSSPVTQNLPIEVATAAGMQHLGFDPADVDEVIAFGGDISNPLVPAYGITFRFNKPFRASAIPPQYRAAAQLGELEGKKYLQSNHPILPSFFGPNNQTLACAPDETLRQLVAARNQATAGPLVDHVRQNRSGSDLYIAVHVPAVLSYAAPVLGMARGQAPPEVQPLFDIPNLLASLELTVNLSGPGPTTLVAHANDEAAADQIQTLITDANQKFQEHTKALYAKQAASEDPVDQAWARYAERVSGTWLENVIPTRNGATLTLFHSDGLDESQKKMLVTGLGVAATMGLRVQHAVGQAAVRNQSMNHMQQISLALLNHHDTHNSYPAHAIYSADDKPLLSWRVAILPFIEQKALYDQFHLDEPWDSEHNKALVAQMPEVFRNPNLELEPGKTNYLAVVGEGMFMEPANKKGALQAITDGTSNTVAFVEADPKLAVEWTKPDDFRPNAENLRDGLGNTRPGGYFVAFCDGSVRFVADVVDPNLLKAMFSRAGGEVVEIPTFEQPSLEVAVPAAAVRPARE